MSETIETGAPGRFKLNATLYLAVIVLASASVVGGIIAGQRHQDRVEVQDVGREYGAVLEAATEEVLAFTNIDYRDMDDSIDKVAAGATGTFKEQYSTGSAELRQIMTDNQSVMKAKVLHAGVASLGGSKARVYIGTTGTVQNTSTGNKPQGREFRIQVDLEKVKGTWRTSDIQFLDGGYLSDAPKPEGTG